MALGQGTIFTASDARKQLLEANRGNNVWNRAYANIEQQAQAGYAQLGQQYNLLENQLNSVYQQSVLDAYKSAQQQEISISASGIGQGYKEFAMAENEALLKQAFDSYRTNYMNELSGIKQNTQSAAQTIGDNAALATDAIDKELDAEATNLANYGNAYFEYISWLQEKDPDLFDKQNWVYDAESDGYLTVQGMFDLMHNEDGSLSEIGNEYMAYLGGKPISWSNKTDYDKFRNWLTDAHSNRYSRPAFRSGLGLQNIDGNLGSLSQIVFNTDDELTEPAKLTEQGIKFFDEVDRYAGFGKNSFGDFLAEKHPELLEWGAAQDEFIYGGKNYHLFQALTGRGPFKDRE